MLPALLRKFHDAVRTGAASVTIWGSGTPLREFLHADDLASAALFLMLNYSSGEIVSVGSGEEISIGELARVIADVTGFRGDILHDRTKPDGTLRKLMDSTRMRRLGWTPGIGLQEGIAQTYAWFCEREKVATVR